MKLYPVGDDSIRTLSKNTEGAGPVAPVAPVSPDEPDEPEDPDDPSPPAAPFRFISQSEYVPVPTTLSTKMVNSPVTGSYPLVSINPIMYEVGLFAIITL